MIDGYVADMNGIDLINVGANSFIVGYRGYKASLGSYNLNLLKFSESTWTLDYAKHYPVGDTT